MKSFSLVFLLGLIQQFLSPAFAATAEQTIVKYDLRSDGPLELQPNLRLWSFNLLPEWVDVTLEYSHNGSVNAIQWFTLGFGDTDVNCTYAFVFEPQFDETQSLINDVLVTERQLRNLEPGYVLPQSIVYVQKIITQDDTLNLVNLRIRVIRPRVVLTQILPVDNFTNECGEFEYYQFSFNETNIPIMSSEGLPGVYNLTQHPPDVSRPGSIPLRVITAVGTLSNTTNLLNNTNATWIYHSCPSVYELQDYTYEERFQAPFVPRVCETCEGGNVISTTELVTEIPATTGVVTETTGIPVTTLITVTEIPTTTVLTETTGIPVTTIITETTGIPLTTLVEVTSNIPSVNNLVTNAPIDYQCVSVNDDNTDFPSCGCSNIPWDQLSLVFVIDGTVQDDDADWNNFILEILNGFAQNVMQIDTNTEEMDVNVVIYGGLTHELEVQRLDADLLESLQTNPIPTDDRDFSNLCNATKFAADYLLDSDLEFKFLVTLPWRTPTDGISCLVCEDCELEGINSFTAKIFDEIDLSLLELSFGAYSACTYLYENITETQVTQQPWPYLLGAVSDFICYSQQAPARIENFTMELLFTSTLDLAAISDFTANLTYVIEESFELISEEQFIADTDFEVIILYFNESELVGPTRPPGPGQEELYTVRITAVVRSRDIIVSDNLEALAMARGYTEYLNTTARTTFEAYSVSTVVYSVNEVVVTFNESTSTTSIETTQVIPTTTELVIPTTTELVIPTTTELVIPTTTEFELPTTTVFEIPATSEIIINGSFSTTDEEFRPVSAITDAWEEIRDFFKDLALWKVILIAIGGFIVLLSLMCLFVYSIRWCMYRRRSMYAETEYTTEYRENAPMIVTNRHETTYTTKQSGYAEQQYGGSSHYNKSCANDDQVYV